MRGVALITAVTLLAEIGDLTRFDSPRQLMAHLGLVPSEHSSAAHIRRGAITKAGNAEARRVMIEAAWCYRLPARVSRCLLERLQGQPKAVRDIAWKAQTRLCARYRRMGAQGKDTPLVTTAIAREMLGFVWAIAPRGRAAQGRLRKSREKSSPHKRRTEAAYQQSAGAHAWGRDHGEGNPRLLYERDLSHARHLDRGSPTTNPGSCGPNPRIRDRSTVVRTVSPPAMCAGAIRISTPATR